MEHIGENVARIRARIAAAAREAGRDPSEITLVAATKTRTAEEIQAAIAAGVTACGENRVQEMTAHLAEDAYRGAELHFIGRLQTNKVKYTVGRVDMIESVDSLRLLSAIEARADKLGVTQDILLEVNIGGEAAKGGVSPSETLELARTAAQMPHIRLRGLMTVPPISGVEGGSRHFFQEMCQLFVDIRRSLDDNVSDMDCLSMGMSGDFEDAVRAGATHVRVGTALFGPRSPVTQQRQG